MLVVTLFSTVSASWGTPDPKHCKNHSEDPEMITNCLRTLGQQKLFNRWSSGKTCDQHFGETDGKPQQCIDYSEAVSCCGQTCQAAPEDPENTGAKTCYLQGGLSESFIKEKGTCDEADENSCQGFQDLLKNAKNLDLQLVCVKQLCQPPAGTEPEETGEKPEETKPDAQPEGPGDDKGSNNNAFTMGLSLAGALIILQL